MNITYTDGSRGEANVDLGKHGGAVLVLTKGYPEASEVVAGIKREHVTPAILAALGVSADSAHDVYSLVK
jgi:hypothetical protein